MQEDQSARPGHLSRTPLPGFKSSWRVPVGLGFTLLIVYLANGRTIGAGDTVPSQYLPIALVRGDGPYLDRFERNVVVDEAGTLAYYAARSRGHIVSRYSIVPALVSVPLVLPQVLVLDRVLPGWDQYDPEHYAPILAKNAQAFLAALVGVILYLTLRALKMTRVAMPTALVAGLGSSLWSVGSQASWGHGTATLAHAMVLWLLLPQPKSRWRHMAAGTATGLMVASRSIDIVFAVLIVVYLCYKHRNQMLWFILSPALIATALIAYNCYYFGALEGGQRQLESAHSVVQKAGGSWNGDVLAGLAGTLVSPSRGLLVYTPWVALSILLLPKIRRDLKREPLLLFVLAGLIPYGLLLSKYSCWWGGWTFGPRFWTDAIPPLALLGGFVYHYALKESRLTQLAFGVTAVFALSVQLVGVVCYPSSWNCAPTPIEDDRERLWDWRDSELTRCLAEGVHPGSFRYFSRAAVLSASGVPRAAEVSPDAPK